MATIRSIDEHARPESPCQPAADPRCVADVWAMTTGDPPLPLERLRDLLSADELARVDRLRRPEDRRRAIVARGGLRLILAGKLGVAPVEMAFRTDSKGKPALVAPALRDLSFNVSHSGDWIVVAVADGTRVGVDVERVRLTDPDRLARRYFSRTEVEAIRDLPDDRRLRAFFSCWTRKEAYAKAIGTGLSIGLDSFAVSVDDDAPPALVEIRGGREGTDRWSLWAGAPAPGYLAALAVESPAADVRPRYWFGAAGIVPWHDEHESSPPARS